MHKSDPLGCLTFPSLKRPAARCYFSDGWFRSSLSSCIKNCPDSTHHRLAQLFPSMKIPFHTGNACSKNCSPDCLSSGHTEGEFLGMEGWLGSGKLSTPESSRYPDSHVPFWLLLGANWCFLHGITTDFRKQRSWQLLLLFLFTTYKVTPFFPDFAYYLVWKAIT